MSLINDEANQSLIRSSLKQAIKCFKKEEFGEYIKNQSLIINLNLNLFSGKSCAYFCIVFKLSSDPRSVNSRDGEDDEESITDKWKGTFLFALDKYVKLLQDKHDFDGIITAYKEAMNSYPQWFVHQNNQLTDHQF